MPFRDFFRNLRLPRDPATPHYIYCNRSHAGSRGIENEDLLEYTMNKTSFTVVRTAELSYEQQKTIFSNARIIVGAHGGSLMNLVYSHCQPTLVELTHNRYVRVQYGWYQFLVSTMGSRYAPVLHPLTEEQRTREYYQTHFVAKIDAIAETVDTVMRYN